MVREIPDTCSGVVGGSIGVISHSRDSSNLPTCHYLIASIVLGADLVVVGQLHLVVVEVEAVKVLVGTGKGETGSRHGSTCGFSLATSSGVGLTDGNIQCTCLKAFVPIFFGIIR